MASRRAGFAAVVLAAGRGTRMESPLAKALHPLGGRPMARRVVAAAREAGASPVVLVVGYQAGAVREAFAGEGADLLFARQEEQRGTAHAAGVGLAALPESAERLFLLCGDAPLLRAGTLGRLARLHEEAGAAVTMLTAVLDDPRGYGRVLREGGALLGVVEEADASEAQREIAEVNAGAYAFEAAFLREALPRVRPGNSRGEFHLPDVIALARAGGRAVLGAALAAPEEALGVNTKADLARAEEIHRRRLGDVARESRPGSAILPGPSMSE